MNEKKDDIIREVEEVAEIGERKSQLEEAAEVFNRLAPQGQSYNRTEAGWVWSENLTPGAPNVVSQISEEEKETTEIPEKGLAALGQKLPKFPRSLSILLIALAIAIFSGIIILFLKKKIKEE